MKCAVDWCTSDAVDSEWVARCCPQADDDEYVAILAAGRCSMHTQQLFGIDVTHRGKALVPPPLAPSDGTIDRKARL